MFVKMKKSKTLESIEAKLVAASKAKAEAIAKQAKEEGDKFRAEFAKGKDVKRRNLV